MSENIRRGYRNTDKKYRLKVSKVKYRIADTYSPVYLISSLSIDVKSSVGATFEGSQGEEYS